MTKIDWKPLVKPDDDAFAATRLQSHVAAQWLSRLASAFIPAEPDYSHSSLTWDHRTGGLYTNAFGGNSVLRAGLLIEHLALVAGPQDRLDLDGLTDADVHQWLRDVLVTYNFDPEKIQTQMPDDLADHPVASGGAYNLGDYRAAQAELAHWFANADLILQDIVERYGHIQPGPSPVRCWPHHFDIATLIALETGDAETSRSVGIGLSPGDGSYDLPYLYVNPWPRPESIDLPVLPNIGAWHTEGFLGAVATAEKIVAASNQHGALVEFADSAIAANFQLLGFSN